MEELLEDSESARLALEALVTRDKALAPGGPNLLGDGNGWIFLSSFSLEIPMCFGFEKSFIFDGLLLISLSTPESVGGPPLGKAAFAAVAAAVFPNKPL